MTDPSHLCTLLKLLNTFNTQKTPTSRSLEPKLTLSTYKKKTLTFILHSIHKSVYKSIENDYLGINSLSDHRIAGASCKYP